MERGMYMGMTFRGEGGDRGGREVIEGGYM